MIIHTFGLDPDIMPRYGSLGLREKRQPLERLNTQELANAVRGSVIAARMASDGGDDTDHRVALVRMQQLAGEMVRRLAAPLPCTIDYVVTDPTR